MATGRLSLLRAGIVIGITLFSLHMCAAPLGYLALRDACNREGGLRVSKTDNADSYLNAGSSFHGRPVDLDCSMCASQVAEGEFTFVDFERPATDAGPAEMVRFQRGPASSANCMGGHPYDKLPDDQCVTVTPLEGGSTSFYRYEREWKPRKALLGVEIREWRQTVYDTRSNAAVATYAHFEYATPAEQYGDFAPSYHCRYLRLDRHDSRAFLRLVLRAAKDAPR